MSKLGRIICVKQCSNCNKEVEIRHKDRLKRKNIFCSKNCENNYKRSHKKEGYLNCECPICKEKFHLKPYQLNNGSHNHYCSIECHRIAKKEYMKGNKNHQYGLKGSKNATWKSDKKVTNYGYIKVRCLNHPYKDSDDMVFEHRLVAEKYLLNEENSIEIDGKRYLKPEYIVHHKDMNKKNNKADNLEIMTLSEHCKLHKSLKK